MRYCVRKVVLGWMIEQSNRNEAGDWDTVRQVHIFRRGGLFHAYTHELVPQHLASGDFLHCARQIRPRDQSPRGSCSVQLVLL